MNTTLFYTDWSFISSSVRTIFWILGFIIAFTVSSVALFVPEDGYRKTTLVLFVPLTILFFCGALIACLTIFSIDMRDLLVFPVGLASVGMVWFYVRIKNHSLTMDRRSATADVRDSTADVRDAMANIRDATIEARSAALDARTSAADARAVAADVRDRIANKREDAARETLINEKGGK